jgi:hypothetical protein
VPITALSLSDETRIKELLTYYQVRVVHIILITRGTLSLSDETRIKELLTYYQVRVSHHQKHSS